MKYRLINGELYREDAESLTRRRICAEHHFRECEHYFLSTDADKQVIALKGKDSIIIVRDIEFIDYSGTFGLIYKYGDNYYLWSYAEKAESNLGSWKESEFYLRKSGNRKIAAYVHNNSCLKEFQFSSVSIDCRGNLFFTQNFSDCFIFDDLGDEITSEYALFETDDHENPSFYHREEDGLYHKLPKMDSCQLLAQNAFFTHKRDDSLALMAYDAGELKELFYAPKENWKVLNDPLNFGQDLEFVTCGNRMWKIDSEGVLECTELFIPEGAITAAEKRLSSEGSGGFFAWFKRLFK